LQPILVDSMGALGSLEYPNAVYGSWFHKNSMNMSKESQQYALGHGCGKVQSTSCSSLKWTDTHTLTHFQTHTHTHTHAHTSYIDSSSGMYPCPLTMRVLYCFVSSVCNAM
jgi:hypothetical protein